MIKNIAFSCMLMSTIVPFQANVNNQNTWQQNQELTEWQTIQNENNTIDKGRLHKYNDVTSQVLTIETKGQEKYYSTYRSQTEDYYNWQQLQFICHLEDGNGITMNQRITTFYAGYFTGIQPTELESQNVDIWICDGNGLTQQEKNEIQGFLNGNIIEDTSDYTQYLYPNIVTEIEYDNVSNFLNNSYTIDRQGLSDAYIYIYVSYVWATPTQDNDPMNIFPNVYQEISTSGYWTAQASEDGSIDIVGLLFEVLGMPFAFISYAFNLTLFPGTQYALNLSHLFLALLVSGIVIFVIKKIYK